MITTTNLLTAFMLGGWIAVTPAAFSGAPAYATASSLQTGKAGLIQSGQRTVSRSRYGGSDYGNLNQ